MILPQGHGTQLPEKNRGWQETMTHPSPNFNVSVYSVFILPTPRQISLTVRQECAKVSKVEQPRH
jgi:hypothetical protein